MTDIIIVTAAFDAGAAQWTATSREAAGLCLTTETWAQLVERLPEAVGEQLPRFSGRRRREVAIEVILQASPAVTVGKPSKYHIGRSAGPSRPRMDEGSGWSTAGWPLAT